MEFKEVMDFLQLKEKADKRAEEVFNLLCELKEFNVSWFMNLSGITYEDGIIWFECSGRCRNEYEEEHWCCGIEYLYMCDEGRDQAESVMHHLVGHAQINQYR